MSDGPVDDDDGIFSRIRRVYDEWIERGNGHGLQVFRQTFAFPLEEYKEIFFNIVKETVQGFDRADDFVRFIRMVLMTVASRMPEPPHAAICALLESMHNRLTKLELGAAFKTKSII